MSRRNTLVLFLVALNLLLTACVYIVLPEGLASEAGAESRGWTGVVTGIQSTDAGDLRVELAIRNETADWSTMNAREDRPAVLKTGDGKRIDCPVAVVGTGGHRLAPGFQIRGYLSGSRQEPKPQVLYVECPGVQDAAGGELAIEYIAYNGELDYYHQEEGEEQGTMVLNLDEVSPEQSFPVYQPVDGIGQGPEVPFPALSDNVISLLDVTRTDEGLVFTWQNSNPTEFPLKIHIGTPPAVCSDGMIYGLYQIMDLADTPLTPAGGKVEWTTVSAVPPGVQGCYILMSVEAKNMRLYTNYAIDITDQ